MISHISLGVRDLDRSTHFYDAVLAPLGYVRVWTHKGAAGYGSPGGPDKLALFCHPEEEGLAAGPGSHLALEAPSINAVRAFHANALTHGGSDEGPPGPRPQYGEGYFAAFVRDPDGHKLEVKLTPAATPR
ncbi:MAG: VOC family protein [Proteobacteria bacterium]|nr:VOC family protein [Pseudomonadota bacterium]